MQSAHEPIADIQIVAAQQPGIVTFDNFEQLHAQLQQVHDAYLSIEYDFDDLAGAKRDLQALRKAKRVLTKAKKQLREGYTQPYAVVEAQLDELIALLKEPEDRVNVHVKEIEREIKRHDIERFAAEYANGLGEFAQGVLASSAFFNPRWLNVSYSDKQWKQDVTGIIDRAADDISSILMHDDDVRQVLLARYYETLSMAGVERFLATLEQETRRHPVLADSQQQPAVEPTAETPAPQLEEEQRYFMELKVFGTAPQMRALLRHLDDNGMSYERGESGKLAR